MKKWGGGEYSIDSLERESHNPNRAIWSETGIAARGSLPSIETVFG
jgi:hypothetical protein